MAEIQGGVRVAGFISPVDSEDTYPVVDPIYGIGGFRVVETLLLKYSIPYARRRVGMIVRVQSNENNAIKEDYRLISLGTEGQDTDESNWELLNLNYQLPVATEQTLGGVKGDGVTTEIEEDGTISVLPLQGELEQWVTSDSGSDNIGNYTRVFRVTIEERYHFCSAQIMAISGGHVLDESQSSIINFSVKKQSEFPSSIGLNTVPDVIVNMTVTSTGNNNRNEYYYVESIGASIEDGKVRITVDVYLKVNRTYEKTKFILLQENISDNATFTHFSNQSFSPSVLGSLIPAENIFLSDVKSKATNAYSHSQVATGNPHGVDYNSLKEAPFELPTNELGNNMYVDADNNKPYPNNILGSNALSQDGNSVVYKYACNRLMGSWYHMDNTDGIGVLVPYEDFDFFAGCFVVVEFDTTTWDGGQQLAEPEVWLNQDSSSPIKAKKVKGHEWGSSTKMQMVVQAVANGEVNENGVLNSSHPSPVEYFFLESDNLN